MKKQKKNVSIQIFTCEYFFSSSFFELRIIYESIMVKLTEDIHTRKIKVSERREANVK